MGTKKGARASHYKHKALIFLLRQLRNHVLLTPFLKFRVALGTSNLSAFGMGRCQTLEGAGLSRSTKNYCMRHRVLVGSLRCVFSFSIAAYARRPAIFYVTSLAALDTADQMRLDRLTAS